MVPVQGEEIAYNDLATSPAKLLASTKRSESPSTTSRFETGRLWQTEAIRSNHTRTTASYTERSPADLLIYATIDRHLGT